MRDPERIERILSLIRQIWTKYPDTRFNQLAHNLTWQYSEDNNDRGKEYSYSKFEKDDVIHFRKDVVDVDLFYLEDDEFEMFLESYLNKLNEVK